MFQIKSLTNKLSLIEAITHYFELHQHEHINSCDPSKNAHYNYQMGLTCLQISELLTNPEQRAFLQISAIDHYNIALLSYTTINEPKKVDYLNFQCRKLFDLIDCPSEMTKNFKSMILYEYVSFQRILKKRFPTLKLTHHKPLDAHEILTFDLNYLWRNSCTKKYQPQGKDTINNYPELAHQMLLKATRFLNSLNDKKVKASDFEQLLTIVAKERRGIAELHQSKNADRFGLPRKQHSTSHDFSEWLATTPLDAARYQSCGLNLKKLTARLMKQNKFTEKNRVTEMIEEHENSKIVINYITPENDKFNILTPASTTSKKNKGIEIPFHAILKKSIDQYKSNYLKDKKPPNGYFVGEMYLKINEQWIKTSSFLSHLPENPIKTDDELLYSVYTKEASVIIMHTIIFSSESLSKNIAELWVNAYKCKENPEKLLNLLAELHYKWAHIMIYERGTAAIGEIIIKSMLKHHGYLLQRFNEGVPLDLHALSNPHINNFIREYSTMWLKSPIAMRIEDFKAPDESPSSDNSQSAARSQSAFKLYNPIQFNHVPLDYTPEKSTVATLMQQNSNGRIEPLPDNNLKVTAYLQEIKITDRPLWQFKPKQFLTQLKIINGLFVNGTKTKSELNPNRNKSTTWEQCFDYISESFHDELSPLSIASALYHFILKVELFEKANPQTALVAANIVLTQCGFKLGKITDPQRLLSKDNVGDIQQHLMTQLEPHIPYTIELLQNIAIETTLSNTLGALSLRP